MRDGERKTSQTRQTACEPFLSIQLFAFLPPLTMPKIITCPECHEPHFDDRKCPCYWRNAQDVARELRQWPDKFRAEAAELRKAQTPKATGGAIVYEDIAAAIDRLLKANAELTHPEPKP